jgi:hypothetical protein
MISMSVDLLADNGSRALGLTPLQTHLPRADALDDDGYARGERLDPFDIVPLKLRVVRPAHVSVAGSRRACARKRSLGRAQGDTHERRLETGPLTSGEPGFEGLRSAAPVACRMRLPSCHVSSLRRDRCI